MQRLTLFFLLCLVNMPALAGIDTDLYRQSHNGCTIEIQHSATTDFDFATLLFRAHKKVEGIYQRCAISELDAKQSLEKAFALYLQKDLKPVTSIFIGRLENYAWAVEYLEKNPITYAGKVDYRDFNQRIAQSSIFQVFDAALKIHGFRVKGASCEKILMDKQDHSTDATCWILIKENL